MGVVIAFKKTPLPKISSARERCLKFSKGGSVSFGGRYTKGYLRKLGEVEWNKQNETG